MAGCPCTVNLLTFRRYPLGKVQGLYRINFATICRPINFHQNMAFSRISKLASIIQENTTIVQHHLEANGLPSPSFDASQPTELLGDDEIAASRQIILEATDELHSLMLGPVGVLTSPSVGASQRLRYLTETDNARPRHSTVL